MNQFATEIIEYIRKNYSPLEKVKTSKNGEQTIFFRKSSKSLCYIDIKEDTCTVVVVIGITLQEKVSSANISQKAKGIFTNAKQFHDGKWLFFEVKTRTDVEDIKTLLSIKRRPIQL